MYLVGNNWANCLKTHNKLTMCLPGKAPSAPSVTGRSESKTTNDWTCALTIPEGTLVSHKPVDMEETTTSAKPDGLLSA